MAAAWDRAGADYTKGIGLDVPPASYETATNEAQGGFGTMRASLGYGTFVAGRVYISGEFEAAFHGGAGPADYMREGTGVGDRDVWPGPWSVEKNRGLGANARLGYAPGGLLGEGGSVYVLTGVHWEQATVRRGSDIGGESTRVVADHTLRPWVAGAGVEWGSTGDRVGLRSGTRRPSWPSASEGTGRRSGCRVSITRSACARSAFRWATPAHSDQGRLARATARAGHSGTLNGCSQ